MVILVVEWVCLMVLRRGWRVCCPNTVVDMLKNETSDGLREMSLGDNEARRMLIFGMMMGMEESIVEVS